LLVEMTQYHSLHSHSCGGDRCATTQSRDKAKAESTYAAKSVTATPATTATREFARENRSMRLLVRLEFPQRGPQLGIAPPASQALTAINIDSSVLPGVIDLEDAVTEGLAMAESGDEFHVA